MMRHIFRAALTCLALLITLMAEISAATGKAPKLPTSVLMNKEALIAGYDVVLGDIASVASSDEALAGRLREIKICAAAEPGSSQTLHIGYVKSRVRQQGILPESINWDGSEQTVVKIRSQELSPQEILSYAEKFIIEQMEPDGKEGVKGEKQREKNYAPKTSRIQVRPVSEIRQIILPYGEIHVKVESMPSASRNGITPLRLIVSVDGRVCERRAIFFKVTVLKDVLVATHTLARHEIVAKDDLRLVLANVAGSLANASVFSQKSEIIGKRAKRMIREGTVIVAGIIEDTPIVNRGDLVTVIIESPTFRITTQGKAREAGARHQMIRVMNISSMKEITAEVVDGKLVRVAFAAQR